MGKHGPRRGSLQFWPRKRSQKAIPSANWKAIKADKPGFLGFIGYKVGMKSAYVKDSTPDSMTKNKRVAIPVTIIETPSIKIFSIRFYKNNKVVLDILNENIDKELKRKLKLPKEAKAKEKLEKAEKELDFDDVSVIVYSQVKKTSVKKTPDIIELGLNGSKEEKMQIIKDNLAKEISISDVFEKGLVDIRGVTKGKGFQGPVKRFGIKLRFHKTEKGERKVGSIGPWHPARVTFRVPMAGQLGYFSRIIYNNNILAIKNSEESPLGLKKYGKTKTDYMIINGCVQGPAKRQVLITKALRPTKKQSKKQYEFIELR